MLRKLPCLMMALALAGCAMTPMADSGADAHAKQFQPSAGMAGLYIYRDAKFNTYRHLHVMIDGHDVGETATLTYLYVELPPGLHQVGSRGVVMEGGTNTAALGVNLRPGTVAFIHQKINGAGWMGPVYFTSMVQVHEDEGRKGVARCKLGVSSSPPPH